MKRRLLILMTALVCLFSLAACSTTPTIIARCGQQGVKSLHVDNYGGNGEGREIVICHNGTVWKDG